MMFSLALAAVGLLTAVALPAEAASASAPAVAVGPGKVITLPALNYYPGAMVVDSVHRHIFLVATILGAPYTSEIVVVDYFGHVVRTIEISGENSLVLSPDGRTVYAGGAPITAVDAATLKATRLDIGAGYRPSGQNPPVIVGGRLWFEADKLVPSVGYEYFIGSIDLHSRHAQAEYTSIPYYPQELAASAGAPDMVVAGGGSGATGKEYFDVYRIVGHGKLEVRVQRNIALSDVAVTADGRYVVTAAGGLYRVSDLGLARSLNVDGYDSGTVSVAPDGEIAIATVNDLSKQRVQVFDERRSTPVQVLEMASVGENDINGIWTLSWNRTSTKLYETIIDKIVGFPDIEIGVSDIARPHCR